MKVYTIGTMDGCEFRVASRCRALAILKTYWKYKKTRNTSYKKFKKRIVSIKEIKL